MSQPSQRRATHSLWTWEVPGAEDLAPPRWSSRREAEAWLGEHWRSLAATGSAAASLLRDGEPVAEVSLVAWSWPEPTA